PNLSPPRIWSSLGRPFSPRTCRNWHVGRSPDYPLQRHARDWGARFSTARRRPTDIAAGGNIGGERLTIGPAIPFGGGQKRRTIANDGLEHTNTRPTWVGRAGSRLGGESGSDHLARTQRGNIDWQEGQMNGWLESGF